MLVFFFAATRRVDACTSDGLLFLPGTVEGDGLMEFLGDAGVYGKDCKCAQLALLEGRADDVLPVQAWHTRGFSLGSGTDAWTVRSATRLRCAPRWERSRSLMTSLGPKPESGCLYTVLFVDPRV